MAQLIAGNWKMNGLAGEATLLLSGLTAGLAGISADLLVCPPFTRLIQAASLLAGSPIMLGAQDCHAAASGAHTGDISADMLADCGVGAVILGHSERRAAHGESDDAVRAKVLAARRAGLMPIVCVGETGAERDAGAAQAVVQRQLQGSLPDGFEGVVAYEPVWAIGTGRSAGPEDVQAMHAVICGCLRGRFGDAGGATRILYGGSVNAANAAQILTLPEVGGALVGGASLQAEAFLAIARAAR